MNALKSDFEISLNDMLLSSKIFGCGETLSKYAFDMLKQLILEVFQKKKFFFLKNLNY